MGNFFSWATFRFDDRGIYRSKYFTEEQIENGHRLYSGGDVDPRKFAIWIDSLIEEHPTLESHIGSDLVRDGAGSMLAYLYLQLEKD